jgi:hypothetical protein
MNTVEERTVTTQTSDELDDQFDDTITVTGLFAPQLAVHDPKQLEVRARTTAGEYFVRVFETRPGHWLHVTTGPGENAILGSGHESEGHVQDGAFLALLEILSDTERRVKAKHDAR